MIRKLIPLLFTWVLSVGWVAAQVADCPALVTTALERAQYACAAVGGNQACYGYQTLNAELSPGLTRFAFNAVGDITPVETIQSLRLSTLDAAKDEWGVAVMRFRADIPDNHSGQNVTLIAFGGVTLSPDTSGDYQPMQAFTFSTDESTSGCTNVTENGLLIQTPEGVGRVTLWINQVKISIGSTVLFQAQPGGDLTVSTFEGSAQVEVMGQMQDAIAGTTVHVPMSIDLQPIAPPSMPEVFDAFSTGLNQVVDVTGSFTDRSVTDFLPLTDDNAASLDQYVADDHLTTDEPNSENVVTPTGDPISGEPTATPHAGEPSSPDQGGDEGGSGEDSGSGNNDGGSGGGGLGDLVNCLLRLCILR